MPVSSFFRSTFLLLLILTPLTHAALSSIDGITHDESNIDVHPSSTSDWLGWGANIYNNRWASTGVKISVSTAAALQPVCKQEYSGGVSAAPLVIKDIAYFPTWSGLFVALDYSNCNVLWQTNISAIGSLSNRTDDQITAGVQPVSRTTPVVDGDVLFLGTLTNALLLAIDKRDGTFIDSIRINDHPLAVVTMSPTLWRGVIFVGASSAEEAAADAIPGYVCCSFIGNMRGVAFEKKSRRFRSLWNQDMIPTGANFSGAAVWGSQPSIDPVRKQVFVATGNVYSVPESYTACQNQTGGNRTSSSSSPASSPADVTDPCAPRDLYQEAILAFDTDTGRINWVHQLSPLDAWNVACLGISTRNPGACPPNPGPDADFGMAPSFVPRSAQTPLQQDTLIVGQKNGNLYALSAADGRIFWTVATSPGGLIGGLMWGVAVDGDAVYYTAVNYNRLPWQLQDGTNLSNSAWGAASLRRGKILWETAVPRNVTTLVSPSVANDVVVTGTGGLGEGGYAGPFGNGSLVVLDKQTGAVVRETMLDRFFQGGIAVVSRFVLFGTGYSFTPNGAFNVWRLSK
ncbi:MAG: hypothetical protein Q9208_006817 [Pyrenodesmia sp. 3 TL-2023]